MVKYLGRGPELITSIITSFTDPDTGREYPVKVIVTARSQGTIHAEEWHTDTIILEEVKILPLKYRGD
jgi:hypothetical protein